MFEFKISISSLPLSLYLALPSQALPLMRTIDAFPYEALREIRIRSRIPECALEFEMAFYRSIALQFVQPKSAY